MANRQLLDMTPAIAKPAPEITFASPGAEMEAASQIKTLGEINRSINEFADKDAIQAGTQAGLEAGMRSDFRPMRSTSLYGQAFDRVGVQIASNQLELQVAKDTQEIYNKWGSQPAALKQALADYGQGQASKLPLELQPAFNKTYQARTLQYTEAARQAYESNLLSNLKATNDASLDNLANTAAATARTVSDDKTFGAAMLQQREQFVSKLLEHAPKEGGTFEGRTVPADGTRAGLYTWQQIGNAVEAFDKQTAQQRVLGQFERVSDKEGFISHWEETARASGKLSPELIDSTSNKMQSELGRIKAKEAEGRALNAVNLKLAVDQATDSYDESKLPTADNIKAMLDSKQITPAVAYEVSQSVERAKVEIGNYNVARTQVGEALNGGAAIDPKDKYQMAALDNAYVQSYANADPQAKAYFAGRTGVIPSALDKEIKMGIRSSDPNIVAGTVATISAMKSANPRVVEQLDGKDSAYFNSINAKLQAGYTPTDAVTKAREEMNVEPSQKEARGEEYKKIVKDNPSASADWIGKQVNSWFSVDPDVQLQMSSEFDQAAASSYAITGDLEGARHEAWQRIQSVWGKTEVGATKGWAKYAPERMYGIPGLSDSQNSEWIRKQLEADVNEVANLSGKKYSADDMLVIPQPDKRTADGKTLYQIIIRNEDGELIRQPKLWSPQWKGGK